MKKFEVGDIVIFNDKHPHAGFCGTVIALEQVGPISLFGQRIRPRVKIDEYPMIGHQCFIMDDGDADIIGAVGEFK